MPRAKPPTRFAQFAAAYPAYRRKAGADAQEAFRLALRKVPFGFLLHALEQQKRSEQWQNPRFIPSMITWLDEERWVQTLPEPPRAPAVQTQRSLTPWQMARKLGYK